MVKALASTSTVCSVSAPRSSATTSPVSDIGALGAYQC